MNEVVLICHLPSKLVSAIDCCIDRPGETALGLAKARREVSKPHLSDHHEVHIACGELFSTSNRPVDKSYLDAPLKWSQSFLEDTDQARGLEDKRLQLRKHRALWIGLVVDLSPLHSPPENPRFGKRGELPLESRWRYL